MTQLKYLTDWFTPKIADHDEVASARQISATRIQVLRVNGTPLTIAPVSTQTLTEDLVQEILRDEEATIICLIPKASHYLWPARQRANQFGSDVQTMSEVFWSMAEDDPQGFLSKDVAYARRVLGQHSEVERVEMICEASMRLIRSGGLPHITLSVDYGYEFSEEALVKALTRHPGVDVVLNSNPNGRATSAALKHAEHAGVRLLDMSSLMGALRRL
ncbi:hypothetical protein [Streptomyces sp. SAI-127]|uniref:hypothetical protein n=1 Tax=Streptomyces sp. SAI-127 TaxID=2940543 RepID=UPI0024738550|nr:hypothetical protein [Streptomyces sp. SAI-127]MDH6487309.1 hypothetical protein [Streptomyces sp. SAI-127]